MKYAILFPVAVFVLASFLSIHSVRITNNHIIGIGPTSISGGGYGHACPDMILPVAGWPVGFVKECHGVSTTGMAVNTGAYVFALVAVTQGILTVKRLKL